MPMSPCKAGGCKAAGSRLHAARVQAPWLQTAGCRLQGVKRGHAQGTQLQLQGCRQRDPRLQAAGCGLQGCRLQGCSLPVADCKGLGAGAHSACSGSFKAAGSRSTHSGRAREEAKTQYSLIFQPKKSLHVPRASPCNKQNLSDFRKNTGQKGPTCCKY